MPAESPLRRRIVATRGNLSNRDRSLERDKGTAHRAGRVRWISQCQSDNWISPSVIRSEERRAYARSLQQCVFLDSDGSADEQCHCTTSAVAGRLFLQTRYCRNVFNIDQQPLRRTNARLLCQLSTSWMTSSSTRRTTPASKRSLEAFLSSGAAQTKFN